MFRADIDKNEYLMANKGNLGVKANVIAVVLVMPIVTLLFGVYISIHGTTCLVRIWVFLIGVLAHALKSKGVLSLGCVKGNKRKRTGFMRNSVVRYCSCYELLSKRQYLVKIFFPLIFTVILPFCWALCFAVPDLLYVSLLLVFSVRGAIYNAVCIMKEPRDVLVTDRHTSLGVTVYYRVDCKKGHD